MSKKYLRQPFHRATQLKLLHRCYNYTSLSHYRNAEFLTTAITTTLTWGVFGLYIAISKLEVWQVDP